MTKQTQKFMTDFFPKKKKRTKVRQATLTEYFRLTQSAALFSVKDERSKKRKQVQCTSSSRYAKNYYRKHKHLYDAAAIRQSYFFCVAGNFCEYAVHTTQDQFIVCNGQKKFVSRGTTIATAIIDNDSALEHISVETNFQRQGIGQRLIQFITKHAPQFYVYSGVEHNSRYRLTEEGAALIKSCQRKGILEYEQVIEATVPQSPSLP